ncbi:MAG: hypothetical protein ACAI43_22815 [Phycisphaerae bacterium]
MRSHRWAAAVAVVTLLAALLIISRPTVGQQKPVATAPATAPATQPHPDDLLPQDNDYVVHEWGTFTSFAGSDGVSLEFRSLAGADLPPFVLDRARQQTIHNRGAMISSLLKSDVRSRQRMETPVTYFYTDKERIVDAVVEFPKGLLTEWYPPVRQFGPPIRKGQPEPLEASWLRWGKIRLLPAAKAVDPKTGIDPLIPTIRRDDVLGEHYAHARATESAHVQLTDRGLTSPAREKFLFYRGVGNLDLPVSVKAAGGGRFVLTNSGKTPLRYAFVMQSFGGTVRFARYDSLAAQTTLTLPADESNFSALGNEVVRALVSEGLFAKEAQAMVRTWEDQWFMEPGTRVLYSLPQPETDRLLPLKLTPAPREMLRVMIGRLELLTPEQERRVEKVTMNLSAGDPAARRAAADELRAMGRFAEPALARVAQVGSDPQAQSAAKALLQESLLGKGVLAAPPTKQ